MALKLHQNAILTGCIDSFCLACESHLRCEQDAVSHIEKPVHIKNLRSAPYLEKFPLDHVRKIKKGYYCEFCNVLLPTAAKVTIHILEQNHNDNKGSQLIKRFGKNVVVCDNILISEQAWNGLIMDTCAICNMEFRNLKLHVTDQKHVLNLIQKKVEFRDGSAVYRKIDETSFHCLICNTICALPAVKIHSKDKDHEAHVRKCRELYQSNCQDNNKCDEDKINGLENETNQGQNKNGHVNGKNDSLQNVKNVSNNVETTQGNNVSKKSNQIPITVNGTSPKSDGNNNKVETKQFNEKNKAVDNAFIQKEKKPTCIQAKNQKAHKEVQPTINQTSKISLEIKDKDELFEHVPEFQKNGVNINFETETAFCKKCFEGVDLDIDKIKWHIKQHKSNPKTEATANTVHTMNENHSRTVLNTKDKDDHDASKPTMKFDRNRNVTQSVPKNKDSEEKEEEIIKIDLRKNVEEEFEETDANNAVALYVPKAGASVAETPKPKATTEEPKKVLDMNDPETFANHHKLTFNKGNGNAFCRICNTRVPAALKNMKEHVNGMPHKTKVARIVQIEKAAKHIPKKPMSKFIHQQSTVMNVHGVDDVILNDKYCLTRMSFFMITTQNRLRCQACEVTLKKDEVSRHVDGIFHERAMERTPVITSLDSEFVREVRRDLYHCGYCNLIAGSWEDVQRHLQCAEHEQCARAARRRRDDHLPNILAHRQNRDRMYVHAFLQQFWPFF